MKSIKSLTVTALSVIALAMPSTHAWGDALTGFYTQVAVGDPDFGGGSNAGGTLTSGMVQNQLGPDGLPVLSTAGVTRLGTSVDMNPTTHELLWWSPGINPYVSLDSIPVTTDTMPMNFGYPNVNWYPTGQTSDQSFFRTVNWQGTFSMASAGLISLSLTVDDDAWAFIDGTLVNEDHYGTVSSSTTAMSAGMHSIEVFYDDRFPVYNAFIFSSSVPFSPTPEPGDCALIVTGLTCFFVYRRKCRK
jgi:hypothetical protein